MNAVDLQSICGCPYHLTHPLPLLSVPKDISPITNETNRHTTSHKCCIISVKLSLMFSAWTYGFYVQKQPGFSHGRMRGKPYLASIPF